jgi:LysR family transcriptional activator of nhaA
MEWLNYHHLLYFWMVAKHGGIARAGEHLRLKPPTLSGQLRQLEDALGEKLFARQGRRLVLTETGRVVYHYADEIFSLGREMQDTVKGRRTPTGLRLRVGVVDVLSKLVVLRLLQPALSIPERLRVVCHEDRLERLLAALAVHELDVILSDAPTSSNVGVRAFNHILGECGTSFFAASAVAKRLGGAFPRRLDGAPFLLPAEHTSHRRSLESWFEAQGIRPEIAGEFDDSALLKAFGAAGNGVFAAPSAIEREVARQYGVRILGRTDEIRERFYAISAERRLRHPAVVVLSDAARTRAFD